MTPAGGSRDDPPGGAARHRGAEPPRGGEVGAGSGPGPSELPELREAPRGSRSGDTDGDGDGDGDPALRAMRSVWLSMRDEEPSDRGMAALLAAARTQAEAMRPRPSWWQLLLAALRRPAVLALATALVLISGAVLIGRRSADEPVRALAPAPASSGPGAGSYTAPAAMPPGSAFATEPAAPGRAPEPETAAKPADVPTRAAPPPPAAEPQAPAAGRARDQASDPYSSAKPAPAPPARAGAPALRHTPPAMSAPIGGATSGTRYLVPQCLAAARRGDCAVVRSLVQQIRQVEPDSLERVTRDQAVDRCLSE